MYVLAERFADFGIDVDHLSVDWGRAVDRAAEIVEKCTDPKPEGLASQGIRLFTERGRFLDPHTIQVGEAVLHADKVVVATGASTARPPISGAELAVTSTEMLTLREPPARLVVIGGGVIGMEFAYMFARLGTRVTVIELTDHILGELDGELIEAVAAHAQTIGVDLHTGTAVRSIASGPDGGFVVEAAAADGALLRVEADLVMYGAGRAPNVSGIGLEAAGVAFDAHGIHTDAALRTNVEHIWAAGDVRSGSPQLAPVATYCGKLAAQNALRGRNRPFDDRLVPYIVGLSPTVAAAGMSEEQATAQGRSVGTHRTDYAEVCPATNVEGESVGFLKIVFDSQTGELLGAHGFGSGSAELVQQMAFAIRGGLSLAEAGDLLFVFPGLSQVTEYVLRPRPGDPQPG